MSENDLTHSIAARRLGADLGVANYDSERRPLKPTHLVAQGLHVRTNRVECAAALCLRSKAAFKVLAEVAEEAATLWKALLNLASDGPYGLALGGGREVITPRAHDLQAAVAVRDSRMGKKDPEVIQDILRCETGCAFLLATRGEPIAELINHFLAGARAVLRTPVTRAIPKRLAFEAVPTEPWRNRGSSTSAGLRSRKPRPRNHHHRHDENGYPHLLEVNTPRAEETEFMVGYHEQAFELRGVGSLSYIVPHGEGRHPNLPPPSRAQEATRRDRADRRTQAWRPGDAGAQGVRGDAR